MNFNSNASSILLYNRDADEQNATPMGGVDIGDTFL